MITATGQNQGISLGLQIGKNQEDSSQDANHGYLFNNIGFIDDISIVGRNANFALRPFNLNHQRCRRRRGHAMQHKQGQTAKER